MESNEKRENTCGQTTNWSNSTKRQATRRCNAHIMVKRQGVGLGCYDPRHVRSVTPTHNIDRDMHGREAGSEIENIKIPSTHRYPYFCSIVIETARSWEEEALQLIQDIGRRTT